MTAADNLLHRLVGLRQTAPDRWVARCPSHDDRGPSLSIRQTGDRLLLRCFAGCTAVDVVGALGLTLRHLFDEPQHWTIPRTKSGVPAADLVVMLDDDAHLLAILAADFLDKRTFAEAQWADVAAVAQRTNRLATLVREWRPSW